MYDENGNNLSEQLFQKDSTRRRDGDVEENGAPLAAGWEKGRAGHCSFFADPFCPYCKQFWQQSRPWVEPVKYRFAPCWWA
jgi:thiol:disulfide interchange protein DsbG